MTKIVDQYIQILTKKKNEYSKFPALSQTENEDANCKILSKGENLKISSSIPVVEKNKRVKNPIYFILMLISFYYHMNVILIF